MKQTKYITRYLYLYTEALSSTKLTNALVKSYEKFQNIASLITLVKGKRQHAIKYTSTKVDNILANSAITDTQKDMLMSSFFSTDDIVWINFAITKALSLNNIKLLNRILASLDYQMYSGRHLSRNLKHKKIILTRLIDIYSNQAMSTRARLASEQGAMAARGIPASRCTCTSCTSHAMPNKPITIKAATPTKSALAMIESR
ncbi:hypothetical protein MNBD_GAMMA12-2475 [hydrothermal vent metagenome]|uniref:Uncharacterized protein n=1 Tax=hydrothermal vent metagenome TaxID=652676 RepID=A0A3B0Z6R5_9ZZZZ